MTNKKDDEAIDKERLAELVRRTSAADISDARLKQKVSTLVYSPKSSLTAYYQTPTHPIFPLDTVIGHNFTVSKYASPPPKTSTNHVCTKVLVISKLMDLDGNKSITQDEIQEVHAYREYVLSLFFFKGTVYAACKSHAYKP